jgi:protein SCO1/2
MASNGLIFRMRKQVFWSGLVLTLLSLPVGWMLLHARPQPVEPGVLKESAPTELPVLSALPGFALTDQDGQPFSLDRMRGKVWIVNFIFTSCPSVCPLLTQKMATLHEKSANLGAAVQLVSFSVDPETDTPAVLKEFRARYAKDPSRWTFVTGPIDAIEAAVEKGFKMVMSREKRPVEGQENAFDIVHGEQFVLVDAVGQIRGYYHKEDAELARLLKDAARLASSGSVQAAR